MNYEEKRRQDLKTLSPSDFMEKYVLDKQQVRDVIKKLSWEPIKGNAYIKINDLIDELEL